MQQEHIYALFTIWNEERKYFYVGRSKREPKERFAEHIRNSIDLNHKEDVYQFIRKECMPCDVAIWYHDVVCWCGDGNVDDYEDFYVIKFIREGHQLQNMKHGDQKRIAEVLNDAYELERDNITIKTVSDLRDYRQRKAFERSEALRRKVLLQEQAEQERNARQEREAAARRGRTPEQDAEQRRLDALEEEREALLNRGKKVMTATGSFHKLFEVIKK